MLTESRLNVDPSPNPFGGHRRFKVVSEKLKETEKNMGLEVCASRTSCFVNDTIQYYNIQYNNTMKQYNIIIIIAG
jgi:hypothetical protein